MGKLSIESTGEASVFIDTKRLYALVSEVLQDFHFKVHHRASKDAVPDVIAKLKDALLLIEAKQTMTKPLFEAVRSLKHEQPNAHVLLLSDEEGDEMAACAEGVEFLPKSHLTKASLRERIEAIRKKIYEESMRASQGGKLAPEESGAKTRSEVPAMLSTQRLEWFRIFEVFDIPEAEVTKLPFRKRLRHLRLVNVAVVTGIPIAGIIVMILDIIARIQAN